MNEKLNGLIENEHKKVEALYVEGNIAECLDELYRVFNEIDSSKISKLNEIRFYYNKYEDELNLNESEKNHQAKVIKSLGQLVEKLRITLKLKIETIYDKIDIEPDYSESIIDDLLNVFESTELRALKTSIIAKSRSFEIQAFEEPDIKPQKGNFVFLFFTFLVVFSCLPFILYGIEAEFINSEEKKPSYIINLVLHIALILVMVIYNIKPLNSVKKLINDADDFTKSKFSNRNEVLARYCMRANKATTQFGIWWNFLAWSFFLLYFFYYVIHLLKVGKIIDSNNLNGYDYEHLFDVVINGVEFLFLYVLYKIVTDDTLKMDKKTRKFRFSLNIKNEIYASFAITFVFFTCAVLIKYNPHIINEDIFILITRALSGLAVAVGLGLLIGRLDSKFIEPNDYQLILLYAYAGAQLLFTLFDHHLLSVGVEQALGEQSDEVLRQLTLAFSDVKIVVLYVILLLKAYFIFFVISIHKKNLLTYYFLLGSKLNDEISRGKLGYKSINSASRRFRFLKKILTNKK